MANDGNAHRDNSSFVKFRKIQNNARIIGEVNHSSKSIHHCDAVLFDGSTALRSGQEPLISRLIDVIGGLRQEHIVNKDALKPDTNNPSVIALTKVVTGALRDAFAAHIRTIETVQLINKEMDLENIKHADWRKKLGL